MRSNYSFSGWGATNAWLHRLYEQGRPVSSDADRRPSARIDLSVWSNDAGILGSAVGTQRSDRATPPFEKPILGGGLHLKPEEILILEALHLLIEHEIEEDFLLESDLKDRILRTSDCLKLEIEPHQTNQLIQKLLQTGILILTFGGTRQRYRLSRLGQSLAKCLLDEVDYGTDQLNALFTSALSGLRTARLAGNDSLKHYLIHGLFDIKELRYYISSLPSDAKRLGSSIRAHWGIQTRHSSPA